MNAANFPPKELMLILLLFPLGWALHAQKALYEERSGYRLGFYNVENLFDAEDDTLKRDEAFLPEGDRRWSSWRYHEKVQRMGKAILSIGGWEPADLVGLCEVENQKTLKDLKYSGALQNIGYRIVHYESKDERGIDVAALYRPDRLILHRSKAVKVRLPDTTDYTRDILVLEMRPVGHKKHFWVIICHWPSRYGGLKATIPKRKAAAAQTAAIVDSLRLRWENPPLVVMGDFNDYPHNESLREILGARETLQEAQQQKRGLVNLMASLPSERGSHRYKGEWGYLDQLIVSTSWLQDGPYQIKNSRAQVLRHPFLLEEDPKYPGQRPFRSFIGFKYHGGFSDHLPVFVDFRPASSK